MSNNTEKKCSRNSANERTIASEVASSGEDGAALADEHGLVNQRQSQAIIAALRTE